MDCSTAAGPERHAPRGGRLVWLSRLASGLRFRLLALILLVLLPAAALTLYTDAAWRRHDTADAREYVLSLARHSAREAERTAQDARELFRVLSRAAIFQGAEPDCARFLAAATAFSRSYTNLAMIRLDGRPACGAATAGARAVSAEHPLFWRVVKSREFVQGAFQADPATGRSTLGFAGPILDGAGHLRAVGFGEVEVGWLSELSLGRAVPTGTTVTLIDRAGRIVAREPEGTGWLGKGATHAAVFREALERPDNTTLVGDDLDGARKLFAMSRLRGLPEAEGHTLLVGLPLALTFVEANAILTRNLLALAGVCVAAILGAWIGLDLVVLRRVRALVGMAERLSAGELSARSGLADRTGELGQLAGALDGMAVEIERRQTEVVFARDELARAHSEMEQRVRERTEELVKANAAVNATLVGLRQAEEQLRASEAQLTAIIGSATDAIVTIDAQRRVLLYNREAERIFGVPASEIIGERVERLVPERLWPALRLAMRQGMPANGAPGQLGPVAGLRADGQEFPIEATTSLVTVQQRRLCTFIIRDITERKRIEETLRKLSRAVEQTAEGVYITDRRGTIEYVNLAFEQQTGYGRDEAIGATPRLFASGQHGTDFYDRLWRTILSGRVFRDVFVNRKKSGELYYDLQTISPVRDDRGEISHFVTSSRDVTQRVRTRTALTRLNAQLEREAVRIAHALHDEAGQFLTAAHIALAEVARDVGPQMRLRLQEVREHLTQVEEQLRSLSRELRPRILEDLGLRDALEFLGNGVSKRTGSEVTLTIGLEGRLPPLVETTIYRLVQEALANATRHGKATHIRVGLTREVDVVRCTIQDNGVGFSVPEMFGRKGDKSLGLIGIRDRLEALGGTLQVSSNPTEGTTLDVLIPTESLDGIPDSAGG